METMNCIKTFLFLSCLATALCYECPPACECMKVMNKIKVTCSGRHITDIPKMPLENTFRSLKLNHNHLEHIERGKFKNLDSLYQLYINSSDVRSIELYAFEDLRKLLVLDLRHNYIRQLNPEIFEGLGNLLTLKLDHNRIVFLGSGAFKKLHKLRSLHISHNGIKDLRPNIFEGLQSLKYLYLMGNKIKNIIPEVFKQTPSLEKLYLQTNHLSKFSRMAIHNLPNLIDLNLNNNPLLCDCEFSMTVKKRKKVNWMGNCSAPKKLSGKSLTVLKNKRMCEIPRIEVPSQVTFEPGQVGIIPCNVYGEPKPKVEWSIISQVPGSNIEILDNSRYEIMDNGTLMLHNTKVDDSGLLQCTAQNIIGNTTARVELLVNNASPPEFTVLPQSREIADGHPVVQFDCAAKGDPTPQISWFHNDEMLLRTERVSMIRNGTIFIKDVSVEDQGNYSCRAKNINGEIKQSAYLKVLIAPMFTKVPEDTSVNIGDTAELICVAKGTPEPQVSWIKNNEVIESNNHLLLDSNNQHLIILNASMEDSGQYSCRAINPLELIEITCTLTVNNLSLGNKPLIVVKPERSDAFKGTMVQLPCEIQSRGDSVVEWTKDGSHLPDVDKFTVTSSGSLIIKDAWINDTGTYQCRVFNDYGEDMATAHLTIQDYNLPGDEYVNGIISSSANEIDEAINNTLQYILTNNTGRIDVHNLFHIARYPNAKAREIARAAEIYERTLDKLGKAMNEIQSNVTALPFNYHDIISKENLDLISRLSGCTAHREINNCSDVCFHRKYRTSDGTCNNLANPTWGSSLTGFRRNLPPIYEDGVSQPVGWNKDFEYNGYALPSARLVSTTIISTDNITEDKNITHMVMQWGQWLDHDLDHSLPSVSSQTWDGVDCKKTCAFAAPCFPIEVPPSDPRVNDRHCIDFVRTSSVCGSGLTSAIYGQLQVREQINQLTSYIDASQVYGFESSVAQDLRELRNQDGKLRVGISLQNQKPLLPTTGINAMDCRRNLDESARACFVSGDIRANEQIGLAAMHTLWMREHNRLATKLQALNPSWSGDKLYQESRKIVGAQMQFITYEHWLPIILGQEGYEQLGKYKSYDQNINPSISNVFATAALRFGHTIINPILSRLDENFETIPEGDLLLRFAFFSPWRITDEGGIDPLLRGMFATPAKLKTPTQNLNKELTEKLFYSAHAVALDLAAINIQRGRDHAIPPYTDWRQFCNMTEVADFDDLKHEISNKDIRDKLKELYGSVHNIDVWVGAILEDTVMGGKVGPLIRCLLIEQFRRLRDGDRFWYESPTTFTLEQLYELRKTSLSRVLCDNGDGIDTIADNVFYNRKVPDELVSCDEIPSMSLRPWIECDDSCGFADRRLTGNNTLDIETTECTDHERLKYTEDQNRFLRAEIENLKKRIQNMEDKCGQK